MFQRPPMSYCMLFSPQVTSMESAFCPGIDWFSLCVLCNVCSEILHLSTPLNGFLQINTLQPFEIRSSPFAGENFKNTKITQIRRFLKFWTKRHKKLKVHKIQELRKNKNFEHEKDLKTYRFQNYKMIEKQSYQI